jgi:hypothetical protein
VGEQVKLSPEEMASLVRQLYKIAGQLSEATDRSFTPDGHMVGSLGEVMAASMYGLELLRQSAERHDAKKGNLHIQIKATGADRVSLSSQPEHLVVLKVENGEGIEIFNGPGKLPWEQAGKLQKNGQKQISLSKLKKLMSDVPENLKLEKIK